MSPDMKRMLGVAVLATAGLMLGSLIAGLIPDSLTSAIRSWAGSSVSSLLSLVQADASALTLGLITICVAVLAGCHVVEVTALLVALHKLRRSQNTESIGRLVTGLERIANPLSLGAMCGLFIALVAFRGNWTGLFAGASWIGPAIILALLFAACVKMSLKKAVLNHSMRGQKEKERD